MIVAGCDVGSLTGKAVILDNGHIVSTSIIPVMVRPERTATAALNQALARVNLKPEDLEYLVGTGYGRTMIPFANENVSEISCHGKGARWLVPSLRTIIDIGGQDCKVISLNPEGHVSDFLMNDKCAAGTGRFLEGMARALGLKLEDMGPLYLKSHQPSPISSQCSVFAESEVVTLLNEGADIADIVAGIHKSIASRLISLAKKVGVRKEFTLTGGVAKNIGVVKYIEEGLGRMTPLPADPQIIGALGAALMASDRAARLKGALAQNDRKFEIRISKHETNSNYSSTNAQSVSDL